MDTYLSLDIGGSKYVVGLVTRDGQILARRKGTWREQTAEGILSQLLDESHAMLSETGEKPVACGVTIPGLADAARGLWVDSSFSGIHNFAICDRLEQALGIPAYCENDGQAYSLAEAFFGSCKGEKNFLFMNVSNGIGGSIVMDGRLLNGNSGFAGEFGHCHAVDGGRPCHCGQKGCLEMYAAGPGIARNYAELGGAPDENSRPASSEIIAGRARQGEKLALQIFDMEGKYLGRVLAMAVNMLNPKKIVIGGGVSLAFDLFADSLRSTLREQTFLYANPNVDVAATPLGYDAGLYSGAAIAISRPRKADDLIGSHPARCRKKQAARRHPPPVARWNPLWAERPLKQGLKRRSNVPKWRGFRHLCMPLQAASEAVVDVTAFLTVCPAARRPPGTGNLTTTIGGNSMKSFMEAYCNELSHEMSLLDEKEFTKNYRFCCWKPTATTVRFSSQATAAARAQPTILCAISARTPYRVAGVVFVYYQYVTILRKSPRWAMILPSIRSTASSWAT